MIWEARLAFILFFFLSWSVVGLFPWVITAIIVRGRGALLALPLALASASVAGVLVPALGQRDFTGFLISLLAALLGGVAGSIGGIAFYRRLQRYADAKPKPAASHTLGSRRPDPPPTSNIKPPPS
ncbi:MAG: hypothetical protein AAB092_07955 [Chloroflexota bacterium]